MAEATLNLGLSILLGYFFGLTGILSGVLISLLVVVYSWKPYFLYKKGFKESISEYILHYVKYLSLLAVGCLLSRYIIKHYISLLPYSYPQWGVYAAIVLFVYTFFSLLLFLLTDKPFTSVLKRFVGIVRK